MHLAKDKMHQPRKMTRATSSISDVNVLIGELFDLAEQEMSIEDLKELINIKNK